ncbi:caspase-8 [Reticulomyxa filosa]|uniref:Caspase-8 n=1 Tax=Reticulomyxa filosa TaxID=46433 RepID=X6M9C6_RETFI|nr:caspase-8 [Reticulomyxa filosa]|eukprot:ETO09620.1 caspase-8 [Reticulomyxa filosa]
MSKQIFQTLKNLPTPLSDSQCILQKHEILIYGGFSNRNCYSYHTLKNEYKFICKYPRDVILKGHCVVKLIDNDNDKITLLSFGGKNKHTLTMKYVSVWSNNGNDNKIDKSNNYNEWIPFTDNHNHPIIIGRDKDNYYGLRAVIGGSNNHLLFITYLDNNISVFNLNTFQFIKHDNLPINNYIKYHCFVSKLKISKQKKNNEMLLFCFEVGLSIEYDEDNNTFQFQQLRVCDDIASFLGYAYVCVNDVILFFGGWNGKREANLIVPKSVHKYSIRENKWMTFKNSLSSPLSSSVAILSEDNMHVHIIGGWNREAVSTHIKTKVSEWLNEEEIEKGIELKIEKKEDENEANKIVKKKDIEEKNKKWVKWWNEREQKDKAEIIEKFKAMSSEQFEVWLLNECKWKNEITKDDIDAIRFSVNAYIAFVMTNEEGKEEELTAYVITNGTKKLIKMKELTFEELLRQTYNCLESNAFQKINNENLKPQLTDMKNNIIESNEDVMKEFKSNEPTFKLIWTSFQHGKTKTIKNAFVIMIAISEYNDNSIWKNLKNVKEKDVKNFKQLFEQEMNYEIMCNSSPKMTKDEVDEFMDQVKINFKLRKNTNKYDGLIIIICGHGENENMLVASDGKHVSINKIRSSFNCHEMESFKDFPKIFIIDACRGENIPKAHEIVKRGNDISYGHNDDGFLMIWSTTKGHQVADLSLLSESMKKVVTSKYKNSYPFKQMLQDIRTEIRNNKNSEWYCVESQDTTDYDIIFQQRESV